MQRLVLLESINDKSVIKNYNELIVKKQNGKTFIKNDRQNVIISKSGRLGKKLTISEIY